MVRVSMFRAIGVLLLSPVLGTLVIVAPPALLGRRLPHDLAMFPVVANGIENMVIAFSVPALILVGCLVGAVVPPMWLGAGASAIVVFPLVATLEVVLGKGAHSLWPIEMVQYGALACFSVAGAWVGARLRRWSGRA